MHKRSAVGAYTSNRLFSLRPLQVVISNEYLKPCLRLRTSKV